MPLFPITTYAKEVQISCAPTVDKWPKPAMSFVGEEEARVGC